MSTQLIASTTGGMRHVTLALIAVACSGNCGRDPQGDAFRVRDSGSTGDFNGAVGAGVGDVTQRGDTAPPCLRDSILTGVLNTVVVDESDIEATIELLFDPPPKCAVQVTVAAVAGNANVEGLKLDLIVEAEPVHCDAGSRECTAMIGIVNDKDVEPFEFHDFRFTAQVAPGVSSEKSVDVRVVIRDDDPENNAKVVAAGSHTCVLTPEAEVKCWGRNIEAQLGVAVHRGDEPGEMGTSLAPTDLGTVGSVVQLALGGEHSCARFDNGRIKCWGDNTSRQLGMGTRIREIGTDGGQMGDALPFVDLGSVPTAVELAVGATHTCAILLGGILKCWGQGRSGRLGQGTTTDIGGSAASMGDGLSAIDLGPGRTALNVSAGGSHTCAVLDDRSLKCWGEGGSGQLGSGTSEDLGDASGEMGDTLVPVELGTDCFAINVAAGNCHTCALIDHLGEKEIKCWGCGAMLGRGATANVGDTAGEMGDTLAPIEFGGSRGPIELAVGLAHSCALFDDGELRCWGDNSRGALGNGTVGIVGDGSGEMGDQLPPTLLGAAFTIDDVSVGERFACARLSNLSASADAKCWGTNTHGQLGQGHGSHVGENIATMGDNLATIDLDTTTVIQVSTGRAHACALVSAGSTGEVKCWGKNQHGQLGQGNTQSGAHPSTMGSPLRAVNLGVGEVPIDISAGNGGDHTCALLASGNVKCWGNGSTWNEPGHMGYGTSANIGDQLSELGSALAHIRLGTDLRVADLVTSSFNSCITSTQGQVKCWGTGHHGNNGLGAGGLIGRSLSQMGDNLPFVELGDDLRVLRIAMGSFHRCALFENLRIKCWGWNIDGELGYEDTTTRGDGPSEMGNDLPFVDLGAGRLVVDVAAGTSNYYESSNQHHTCAVLDDGTVKCWGSGNGGRLGYGDGAKRGHAADTMGSFLPTVDLGEGRAASRVFVGGGGTCALLDDQTLKCWGSNSTGQLGYDNNANVGQTAATMGDYLSPVALGSGRYALQVSASFRLWGADHRCALLDDFSVKCWGDGDQGKLGSGSTETLGNQAGEMDALLPVQF